MDSSAFLWPSGNKDFWKIECDASKVFVKWSHNYFEDYKQLAYNFVSASKDSVV